MKRCFTLIELLVVIAIIALLIGILIPVLGQVREKSRNIKCMANLRSQGQALTMYVDTYKEYYVHPNYGIMEAEYLIPFCDAAPPSMEVKIDPWVCPKDNDMWMYDGGYSYQYWPSTYWSWARLQGQNSYSKYKNLVTLYAYERNAVYFSELLWWHDPNKRNAVFPDNSVKPW